MFKVVIFATLLIFSHLNSCKQRTVDSSSTRSQTLTAKEGPLYSGPCTPDGTYCAHFSPADIPVHFVADSFRSAKKTIRIATYNINIAWYANVLKQKLDEGVKVELLLDFTHSYATDGVWSLIGNHPNLTKLRVPVLRGSNPQMHNKIIIIDSETLLFGSANWTYTGLAGNFENVFSTHKRNDLLIRFEEEVNELKAFSEKACQIFADDSNKCGTGNETYPAHFKDLGLNGFFSKNANIINTSTKECADLVDERNGPPLVAGNQPKIADIEKFKSCFIDPSIGQKYGDFVQQVSALERYADGTLIKDDPITLEDVTLPSGTTFKAVKFNHKDQQTGRFRAYFSGEDNVEWMITRELRATTKIANPMEAFAYLSTNFITNKTFAKELVAMKEKGVRLRVFFDRGRFTDQNFHSAFKFLSQLGFTYGLGANKIKLSPPASTSGSAPWKIEFDTATETEISLKSSLITAFNNDLSGAYGANHNKFAIIGVPNENGNGYRLTLINGSANWSAMAMQANDENLVVAQDDILSAIYLREVIGQLFVYRYAQNINSAGFQEELDYLRSKVPCFSALIGQDNSCKTRDGIDWSPNLPSPVIIAVKNVPIAWNNTDRRVWAWVANFEYRDGKDIGKAFELFSSDTFESKWVTSFPIAKNWKARVKFFTAPVNYNPNKQGVGDSSLQWEYSGADREFQSKTLSILSVPDSNLKWGQR